MAVTAPFVARRDDVPFLELAQRGSAGAGEEGFDGGDLDDAVEEGGGLFQGPGVVVFEVAGDFLPDLFGQGGEGCGRHG